jgi:hypothetical protein
LTRIQVLTAGYQEIAKFFRGKDFMTGPFEQRS